MKEPGRLREENASALERALLEAGASYRGPASARAKTLGALGLAGSATLLAGAAQAAPLSAFAKVTWTKLLATISFVGVAAAVPVGYYAWHRHPAVHAPGARSGMVAAARAEEAPEPLDQPPAAATVTVTVTATALPPAPVRAEAKATERPVRASKLEARPAAPPVTLARELSSIDSARSLLARGDAEGALARLDAYTRGYPRGRLELEAEVLRIDALDQDGRSGLARERAETFLRRHPNSVLAARVRARLGD
jgi:hypothetical protein